MQLSGSTLRAIVSACLFAGLLPALQAESLDDLKKRHEGFLRKVNSHRQEQVKEHSSAYAKALQDMLAAEREAGNLERTLTLTMEARTFEKTGRPSTTPSDDEEIAKLQESYNRVKTEQEKQVAKDLVTLFSIYDRQLGALQREKVRAGNLEEATAIKAERSAAASNRAHTASKMIVKRHGIRLPPSDISFVSALKLPKEEDPAEAAPKEVIKPFYSDNLLKNPGCEEALVSKQIPGWTQGSGNKWVRGSKSPGAKQGSYFFSAGKTASAELTQTVDVSKFQKAIEAGVQKFLFEGYICTDSKAKDRPSIVIEYLDKTGSRVLYTFNSGTQSFSRWVRIRHEGFAPKATHAIRVKLLSKRYDGSNNAGFFDVLSLKAIK